MALYSTAAVVKQEYCQIPEFRVVEKPLYLVGTQVRALHLPGSWEAFKDDLSVLYHQDSRWCGGRFLLWTFETYGDFGKRLSRRQGHWITETGVYIYSGPKGAKL
jgi:hypothetical protein